MAVSYTSLENAHKNLESEITHWDFAQARKEAQNEWNSWFGKIKVEGGTEAQRIKFYTDLWHVLLGRHKIDDVSGDYPDYTEGEVVGSHTLGAKFKLRTLPKDENGNGVIDKVEPRQPTGEVDKPTNLHWWVYLILAILIVIILILFSRQKKLS